MATANVVLSNLCKAGQKVQGDLDNNGGCVEWATQVVLSKAITEAEAFLASAPAKRAAAKPKGKLKTVKQLLALLRPYIARSTLPVLHAVHVKGGVVYATDLELGVSVEFANPNYFGSDFSLDIDNLKALGNLPLDGLSWSTNTLYGAEVARKFEGERWDVKETIPTEYLTAEEVQSLAHAKPGEVSRFELRRSDTVSVKAPGGTEFKLDGLDPEDAPKLLSQVEETVWTGKLSLANLERVAEVGKASAATDGSRPVLTTVKIEIGAGVLRAVAADGFTLLVDEQKVDPQATPAYEGMWPYRWIAEAVKTFKRTGVTNLEVTVYRDKLSAVGMSPEGFRLRVYGTLVEGRFPDYNQVVPASDERVCCVITANRAKLIDLAKVLVEAATDNASITRLTFEGDQVTIKAGGGEFKPTGLEVWGRPQKENGTPLELGLSADLLLRLLQGLQGDKVHLEMRLGSNHSRATNVTSPVKVVGTTGYAVQMPMQINR